MSSQAVTQAGAGISVVSAFVNYIHENPVAFFFMSAGLIISLFGLWFQYRKHKREIEYHRKRMAHLDE